MYTSFFSKNNNNNMFRPLHRKPESEQTEEDISDKVLTWKKSEKQSNHMTTEETKKPLTHLKSEAVDTVRLLMDKSGLSRNDHSTGDDFSSAALSSPSNSMYVLDTTTNTNTSNSNNNTNLSTSSILSESTSNAKGKYSKLQKLYEKIVSK